jgi:phosphatidylserine/phosphatidylglycerophosphate/cardiolipin synthase-like enzyme
MRKCTAALIVLLMVLPGLSTILPSSEAGSVAGLRLFEVLPTGDFEGVTLYNYGADADLSEYALSDGEGKVTFSSSYVVHHGESVSVLKSAPAAWFSCHNCLIIGTSGVSSKSFALNDSGDEVMLMHRDSVIDSFVYGKSSGCDGWKGDPFQKIDRYSYAKRCSIYDTDTAADWKQTVPGRTGLMEPGAMEAAVEPFAFPDSSGMPVMRSLSLAQNRVDVSVYIVSHPAVVAVLMSLLSRGIDVNILFESSPAGGVPDSEIAALAALSRAGADVRAISAQDGFRRYTYLHCKYAVIDSDESIITSENWVESSFGGNRGWGAIVISDEYAGYMRNLFEADFSSQNCDVKSFRSLYPTAVAGTYSSYVPDLSEGEKFRASVTPLISPDDTFSAMQSLISSAGTRVYSQQLDVQYNWLTESDNPVAWLRDAGARGVDCRLIVDVTFDDPNDSDVQDGYGVMAALEGVTGLEVRSCSGYSLVHNKGVIADDKIWLGSVNWTYNSFLNNREAAVLIDSTEVAHYYAGLFMKDWGTEASHVGEITPEIRVKGDTREGSLFMLDASGTSSSTDSVFTWDLDGDGKDDRTGERIAVKLSAGTYKVTLTVKDAAGNSASGELSVTVVGAEGPDLTGAVRYVPLVIVSAIVILRKAMGCAGGKDGSAKGVHGRGRRGAVHNSHAVLGRVLRPVRILLFLHPVAGGSDSGLRFCR